DFEGRVGKERAWFPQPAPKFKNAFIYGPDAGERRSLLERSHATQGWGERSREITDKTTAKI
ncbi:MAG: hypothetical protein WAX79_09130, partial [Candidatus Omnitrophota bacterium]